jgi:predicted transposase YbfD/YdcC
LKGNQGTLHDDVSTFRDDPARQAAVGAQTVDADHGRIETRTAMVSTDIGWLQAHHHWPGLAAIGKLIRVRETAVKTTTETAYYLLGTALSAERFNEVACEHWGVENRLHWRLDVVMNEDQDRTRSGNGPQNHAILRHMALNIMQQGRLQGVVARQVSARRLGQRLPHPPPGTFLKCDCPGIFWFVPAL